MTTITYRFEGYAGWDLWLSFLPETWQARSVAKALVRGPYKTWDWSPENPSSLIVQMPQGSYRVLDARGRVERCARTVASLP